jgi:hypothetical protein
MSPDEHTRHEVQTELARVVGPNAASYVMTHLPPEEWPHLATKSDIDDLRTATKSDIDDLRTATKSDIDDLRTATKSDMAELRAATKADIAVAVGSVRSDMEHGFELARIQTEALREMMLQKFEIADANMRTTVSDLASAIRLEMISQTRAMIVALATIMVALVAAFIAAR